MVRRLRLMTTPDSEETRGLLERARGGDRQAFERLFTRHRDYLRRVIELRLDPRLRPRLDASDVIQDTQLEAFRRLPDYLEREPMPFRLWLRMTAQERLGMAQRQHVGAARRTVSREARWPEQSSLQLAAQFLAAGSTPSQRLSRRELVQEVHQAIAQLSEVDREILLMRNLEGLSNQETAQVLQIDPAAASQRYGRALLRLRQLLIAAGLIDSQR
jgi:RNA polymerase sigma-70 factor (ECF subfamily)